ncbi:sin3 histone deacetylase corepressor complex component sds3 [Anaeramoeba flamelloides]|uniref:Sin3 histone deacetylase corepressor complex component sds3 n=1 Tax=Anaeramoeba flamelloides TaxID=1746091 RepID=A0AAV7ZWX2_9EUKA|nr:sin3 histone deacetylase corepressor complex component sds3 [Anaeramoeba flamelloides]
MELPKQEENLDTSTEITESVVNSLNENYQIEPEFEVMYKRKQFLLSQISQLDSEIDQIQKYVLELQMFDLELQKKKLQNNNNEKYLKELNRLEKQRDEKIMKSKNWLNYLLQNAKKTIDSEKEKIQQEFKESQEELSKLIIQQYHEDKNNFNKTGNVDYNSFSKLWEESRNRNKNRESINLPTSLTETSDLPYTTQKLMEAKQPISEEEANKDLEMIKKGLNQEQLRNIIEETTDSLMEIEVTTTENTLKYGNLLFKTGDYVYVHTHTNNNKWFGVLSKIKNNKVVILYPDSSQTSIYLFQLKTGKFSLSKAFEDQIQNIQN